MAVLLLKYFFPFIIYGIIIYDISYENTFGMDKNIFSA